MLVYIIGKPRNQEELEAIWGHENIVFVNTVEEYRAHRDAQSGSTHAIYGIVDDEFDRPVAGYPINVGSIGHLGRDKSQLTALISKMDFRNIELRIAAHLSGKGGGMVILDEVESPLEAFAKRIKIDEPIPMPIEYHTRRSKGDKHRNRRYRWS